MSTVPRDLSTGAATPAALAGVAGITPADIQPAELPICLHLEEMKAELAKTLRAFLEQDERAKGTFPSFAEARQASDLAESLAQQIFELRLRLKAHRELHGCA